MTKEPTHRGRKTIRLPEFDYSTPGAYFVTIVTEHRRCLFGEVSDSGMKLNDAGRMILDVWAGIPKRFAQTELNLCVVMPNHFHGILNFVPDHIEILPPGVGAHQVCAPPTEMGGSKDESGEFKPHGLTRDSLGRIVQNFKTHTTNMYIRGVKGQGWQKFPGKLWQRNYYEQIIRDDNMLNRAREYILTNPLRWELDKENPSRKNR